jgi:hypothetical protein
MTLQDRAAIIGQYPTAGLGGGQTTYLMPDGLQLQYSTGRNIDTDGNIVIEGTGVLPTVKVPVDEDTLFAEGDPVQDAAEAYLDDATRVDVTDGGEIAIGDSVIGELNPQERVRYTLTFESDAIISIVLSDDTGELDTYLRLYNQADNLLAENDDAEAGAEPPHSALTDLEVPAGFVLVIEVATFNDESSGNYTLQILNAEPAAETTP